ncbi:branched-chain amino acid ABC transporter permease [Egibacter rhizosphaerae]|uniref:Branched-chain amino acid ABC transporter permease n=1 Tax=Egibacter rhizosphaerae TaxID=1670831 RepID=A0A411YKS1_9ACTN|nr:branched-chain amino acid ABC transporter permease [Egibacter rhizosphaerae]QBI21792.1 branched-chain amino acid ABC transporter permease [Egibacter rhizosphaerae]
MRGRSLHRMPAVSDRLAAVLPGTAEPTNRRLILVGLLIMLLLGITQAGWFTAALADDGEGARGTLRVDGDPIAEVEITAVDEGGAEVASTSSDDSGSWELELPGPGTYDIVLDPATLPEELDFEEGESPTDTIEVGEGQTETVLFRLEVEETVVAGTLSRLPQNLLNGVKFGLIVAMTAIGLSLIFGTTRLINFSHGELVSFGAIVAWFLNVAGIHIVPAALLAMLAGAALGGALDHGLWRPLRRRKTGIIQLLVITVGLAFLIRNVLLFAYGGSTRSYAGFAVQESLTFGPFRITPRDLIVLLLSFVVLVLVGLAISRTRIGKAMRAVSDDSNLAETSGIDVQRVILLVWVAGAGLTALGGVFLGLVEGVNYFMGFRLLLLIFAGVILGGLGTAYGAMVGSLVVGIITEVSTIWFSPDIQEMWALLVLIVILLFRPQGILGFRERVG